ncbi:MAG TPA: hypothetical protein V6C96_00460, partial [Vampirovibrionales bacterium]
DLAVEGGYLYAGESGYGHFVKLVHNGIEFGMLQAIGEGISLLKNFDPKLNLEDVLHCWRNGSVIRSWLVELLHESLKQGDKIDDSSTPAYIEDTGEVNWLVEDSLKMEVPIPVISQSVMELFKSREQSSAAYQAIALMRRGFGGHPLGEDKKIKEERQSTKLTNNTLKLARGKQS